MKKLLSIITCAAMTVSMFATGASAYNDNVNSVSGNGNTTVIFYDVPNSHWAKDQIDYFVQRGIVDGYGDGTFRPEEGVTREEFCKLLVTTFNQPLTTPASPTFSDVLADRWSYPYVEVCREFLTGYANPFGGSPSFHPDEYATREDIAVALVKMMGYTESDASGNRYAISKFDDGEEISPGLVGYVSIACKLGLISGYPDGTFAPAKGITRAETISLLNRATKQAVTDISTELEINAGLSYSNYGKTVTVQIEAEENTTVTVDGNTVRLSRGYYDEYTGEYVYTFEEEGSHTFKIEAKKGAMTKSLALTAIYQVDVPVLTISSCPSTTKEKTVTVEGTVTDSKYSVSLTINGYGVSIGYGGDWSKTISLSEGQNKLVFVATNAAGKSVKQERTITYKVDGPDLSLASVPSTSKNSTVTLKGKLTDANYGVSLMINGESVYVAYDGSWSKTVSLDEGVNTYKFVATNTAGKKVTQEKSIVYRIDGPELNITNCPSTVSSKQVTLKGTLTDANYGVSLTINGESVYVGSDGSWSKTITLDEGENSILFIGMNTVGKTDAAQRTITFTSGGPELNITSCPSSSKTKAVTLKGTVTDANYNVSLTINGESVYVGSDGSWSKEVSLEEGNNVFTFKATNSQGKTTTQEKTISFTAGSSSFAITNCPKTVSDGVVTISGTLTDDNYDVTLTINGERVNVYNGEWSKTFALSEGENEFVFVAVNGAGKQITQSRTVTFKVDAPEIQFINCPDTSNSTSVAIKGRITGGNDGAMLFVNNSEVNVGSDGSFTVNYELGEGDNTIEFRAVNSYGKSASAVKVVTYVP